MGDLVKNFMSYTKHFHILHLPCPVFLFLLYLKYNEMFHTNTSSKFNWLTLPDLVEIKPDYLFLSRTSTNFDEGSEINVK